MSAPNTVEEIGAGIVTAVDAAAGIAAAAAPSAAVTIVGIEATVNLLEKTFVEAIGKIRKLIADHQLQAIDAEIAEMKAEDAAVQATAPTNVSHP